MVDVLTEGSWGHAPGLPYDGPAHPDGKAVWVDLPVRRGTTAP